MHDESAERACAHVAVVTVALQPDVAAVLTLERHAVAQYGRLPPPAIATATRLLVALRANSATWSSPYHQVISVRSSCMYMYVYT